MTMERALFQCHENMQETMKTSEGLGIEYDESVICDVCRSPDSEETNEMVFCDNCDICIHQVSATGFLHLPPFAGRFVINFHELDFYNLT